METSEIQRWAKSSKAREIDFESWKKLVEGLKIVVVQQDIFGVFFEFDNGLHSFITLQVEAVNKTDYWQRTAIFVDN